MIIADIAVCEGERALSSGRHRLVAVPNVGDSILLYNRDGESVAAVVSALHHYPLRQDGVGPSGDPSLIVSVTLNNGQF